MISWRDIVQTVRFQRLLTALVLLTVESVLRQLKERDAISEAECKRLITQLSTFQNSDITVLQNVFYIEVNPVAKSSSVDQAIRLNVFLRTISKLERYNQNPKLHFLIFRFRELISLLRILRDARNAAAHDFSDRPEIGWNLTVFSTYMRVLEVAVIPNKFEEQIEKQKEEIKETIVSFLNNGRSSADESYRDKSPSSQSDEAHSNKILDEINAIKSSIASLDTKFLNLVHNIPNKAVALQQEVKIETDEYENETEELENIETQMPSAITAAVLKQKLESLRKDIDEEFSKDADWHGIACNILQKPIVAIISKKQYPTIAKALSDEEIMWRYKRHKDIMDKQIVKFDTKIDEIIASVIWDD